MKELVMLAVGIGMTEKMRDAQTIERFGEAETLEEKTAIVRETEKFCFEIADDIFKSDEEIGEEGIEQKLGFIEHLVTHQYHYFELDNPLENGTTFEEIRRRNGYLDEEDEFFTN